MGYDDVEGTSCPDYWPEEQVLRNIDKLHVCCTKNKCMYFIFQQDNVERLAAGDEEILEVEPSVLTLKPATTTNPVPGLYCCDCLIPICINN